MLEVLGLVANAIGWLITVFVVFLTSAFVLMIGFVFIQEVVEHLKRKWGI